MKSLLLIFFGLFIFTNAYAEWYDDEVIASVIWNWSLYENVYEIHNYDDHDSIYALVATEQYHWGDLTSTHMIELPKTDFVDIFFENDINTEKVWDLMLIEIQTNEFILSAEDIFEEYENKDSSFIFKLYTKQWNEYKTSAKEYQGFFALSKKLKVNSAIEILPINDDNHRLKKTTDEKIDNIFNTLSEKQLIEFTKRALPRIDKLIGEQHLKITQIVDNIKSEENYQEQKRKIGEYNDIMMLLRSMYYKIEYLVDKKNGVCDSEIECLFVNFEKKLHEDMISEGLIEAE